jgi:hypothetical protein
VDNAGLSDAHIGSTLCRRTPVRSSCTAMHGSAVRALRIACQSSTASETAVVNAAVSLAERLQATSKIGGIKKKRVTI